MRHGRRTFALAVGILGTLAITAQETGERFRPQFHFSPKKNWTNDPNGLIFFAGEYHLFFQYNPFGDRWGHMSWGHAVSRDLLHWQELPVALPESDGVMVFTGSTVIDERNSTGFCAGGKPCMVAVYTGHTPEANGKKALQTQNLAYSNDHGRTWTKYKGNPVLDKHMSDFRDPKVFWSDASKRWVMAVALPDDHKVLIYHSKDLKAWSQVSEFGPAGATGGQWECPELFETPVEGKGETRWVMKVGLNPGGFQGGSGEQYFVGRFDGTRFTNENAADLTLPTDYGKDCYCALTFNNLPRSHKAPVVIGWMDNWQYAADLPTAPPWRGQMTVPRQMSLRQTPDGLRLVQTPLPALEARRTGKGAMISDSARLNEVLARAVYAVRSPGEIDMTVDLGEAQSVALQLGKLEIGYDHAKQTIYMDRSRAGDVSFSPKFPARTEAPLPLTSRILKLRVIIDHNSVEMFADNGRVTMTNLYFPSERAARLQFASTGAVRSAGIHIWELKP